MKENLVRRAIGSCDPKSKSTVVMEGSRHLDSTKRKRAEHHRCSALKFPGRVLLSHDAIAHSTIGAEGLNCRVRDGNGCFTFAMTTGNHALPLVLEWKGLKCSTTDVGIDLSERSERQYAKWACSRARVSDNSVA